MRVLWISCLLIGSISCVPTGKKYGSGAADTGFWQQPYHGNRFSGGGVSSDPGSSSSLSSVLNPSSGKPHRLSAAQNAPSHAAPGSYSRPAGDNYFGNRNVRYNSPVVTTYGAASQPSGYDSGASRGNYGYGSYASAGSGSAGDASYGFVTSSDAGDEGPEPVFSDVSDLEPVYSSSSRSRYQRGRAMYTKTRYTPGESGPVVMSGATSETSNQNYPAKAPAKGGY
ncbi:prisilkin-39-like [Scomber scombrus]|uniref:Prisilkin-39-like n=1 Tax=Scomber scombrus TaxID=13677 RepID=A0AAV1QBY3_SCOSC